MDEALKKNINDLCDPSNPHGLYSNDSTAIKNLTNLLKEYIDDKEFILYAMDKIKEKLYSPDIN